MDDNSVQHRPSGPNGRRSELQAVETGAALLSGVLAFLLVEVLVWLVKALLDVTDPAWSGLTGYGFWLAAAPACSRSSSASFARDRAASDPTASNVRVVSKLGANMGDRHSGRCIDGPATGVFMAFQTPAPQEIIVPADILADRGYHGPDLCYRLAPDDPRTGYSHYVCADNPSDQLPQHRAGHELS